MDDDVVFELCGSSRESPIVKESVPGSVALRYRGIRYVSAKELIQHFDENWFITFPTAGSKSSEAVLTITNGSETPEQPSPSISHESNSRGTLVVTKATASVLTGKYCVRFLKSGQDAHDIFVTGKTFELHRLIADLVNLKIKHPELFTRKGRSRGLGKKMKKTKDAAA